MIRRLLDRFASRRVGPRPRPWRAEAFGGIVQLARPRALVFVDRARARSLSRAGGELWSGPDEDGRIDARPLTAPLEAHLQLTNRCDAGCRGCYTAATPHGTAGEWGLSEWKRAIDVLADAGVFHLALGGGESAELDWLGEVAAHARSRGMIPNLTTSGLAGVDRLVEIAHLFGQINVSIDGVGDGYALARGYDGFARADAAVRRLRAVTREVGLNCVVTRQGFARLEALFRYARRLRLSEIELLRVKPAGRGRAVYSALACSGDQHRELLPTVLRLARRHLVRVRLDCSYVPMIAWHDPGRELLASLAVYGCTGGDFLIGVKATGEACACSFAAPPAPSLRVDELPRWWGLSDAFATFRGWRDAIEPCRSCAYLDLCRGGCRVVAEHALGDPSAPDPECPRVVTHARSARVHDRAADDGERDLDV